MTNLIDASEFLKLLKKEGLVIIEASEYDALSKRKLHILRNDLLVKKWVTISELLKMELLPVKSKSSLNRWIADKIIKENEVSVNRLGRTIINVSFLKRLGYIQ